MIVPATLDLTVVSPVPATVDTQAGTLIFVGDGTGSSGAFTYDFTVPAEEVVLDDGVKITLNMPSDGMLTINLYDVGVVGRPAELVCSVYSRTNGCRYMNWGQFASWGTGLFCGSAPEGDELTITILGAWNEAWD